MKNKKDYSSTIQEFPKKKKEKKKRKKNCTELNIAVYCYSLTISKNSHGVEE